MKLAFSMVAVATIAFGAVCPGSGSDPGQVVGQGGCTVVDKDFGTISLVSGTIPSTASVRYFQQIILNQPYYTMQISGNLDSVFSIEYDVTVTDPAWMIDVVSADLSNPAHIGTPMFSKIVSDGVDLGTITATATNPGASLTGLTAHHLHIVDTYSPGGGAAAAFGNTFHQTLAPTPEPATLGIAGAGLLIAITGSRMRKRNQS